MALKTQSVLVLTNYLEKFSYALTIEPLTWMWKIEMKMIHKISSAYKPIGLLGLLSLSFVVFAATWTQAPPSAKATPCSCWDSGTSVYMGAKCHAAWKDMDDDLEKCLNNPTCRKAGAILGIPLIVGGIVAMEQCHHLCNATQESGASGYKGNEWWYADQTAYNSCLSQNPNVLQDWMPTMSPINKKSIKKK